MIYFVLIVTMTAAVYFACRLFLLRSSIARAEKELLEISRELEQNRVVKLAAPERGLERLLEAVNENLMVIREERINCQQKECRLREQIENISHDLRTPLTAILGYLKMMDMEDRKPEEREYLEIAIRKSDTLQALISEFYELSRVTAENFRLNLVKVDGARILRECCLDHYGLLEKKKLLVEIPGGSAFLYGDEEALERIFVNLLQNGVRYAKSEMNIKMCEDENEKKISFIFENDIEPDMAVSKPERLFERFYMQERSRSRGGTGLGLTISKQLTEHMGGTVYAEYREQEGKCYLRIVLI